MEGSQALWPSLRKTLDHFYPVNYHYWSFAMSHFSTFCSWYNIYISNHKQLYYIEKPKEQALVLL